MLHYGSVLFSFKEDLSLENNSLSALELRRKSILGQEFETNNSGRCFIFEYKNSEDVLVMFEEYPSIVKCSLYNLKKGKVKNPYRPNFNGKGYMGVGSYSFSNRKHYQLWTNMLIRAYDANFKRKCPSYRDVEVCEEWLNFQNFAKWCDDQKFFNAKDESGKSYHLDKDILVKGSKVYSPKTCCFVPNALNQLVVTKRNNRGSFPIGVTYNKTLKLFISNVGIGADKLYKHLGYFKTPEKAFLAYKQAKESFIKEMAEVWKVNIDSRTYQALMSWKIEVND